MGDNHQLFLYIDLGGSFQNKMEESPISFFSVIWDNKKKIDNNSICAARFKITT